MARIEVVGERRDVRNEGREIEEVEAGAEVEGMRQWRQSIMRRVARHDQYLAVIFDK